ncbi:hypothetical protein LY28_01356 [Ruminiclostridium sufflavum DSM 19573]|uniref:Uncharacterized protein n=1 Tax=Ruminiclostridium sufflavum DSM 19573 TaxID=1121337 RepID=A0A318XM49_9FIRM|nr:hypothetical protein [Ruminiclostridium sufflavum]PYG88507.1 hypothetical protein LY28_01356 [Ruminiclostridium sufflavum DSM 19573]
MKKVLALMLVLCGIINLSFVAIAADNKNDGVELKKVENILQEDYGVIETDIGTAEIKYKVIKKSDYYEVQADANYQLFQEIQFGEYKYSEKKKATEQVKQFAEKIYTTVITLYPDVKWHGFYSTSFESICGYRTSRLYFNWCNFKDDKIVKTIQWLTGKDSSWDLAICEWLEK